MYGTGKCLLLSVFFEPLFVLFEHRQAVIGHAELCPGNGALWMTESGL
jgi:hypothetical protein